MPCKMKNSGTYEYNIENRHVDVNKNADEYAQQVWITSGSFLLSESGDQKVPVVLTLLRVCAINECKSQV